MKIIYKREIWKATQTFYYIDISRFWIFLTIYFLTVEMREIEVDLTAHGYHWNDVTF